MVGTRFSSVLILFLLSGIAAPFSSAQAPAKPATPKKSTTATTPAKKPAAKSAAARTARRNSPRVRRIHQAFVASADLKPMAQQLLQNRTPAAYDGVEAYARRHSKDDAGALAWLVVGYARILDNDYARAVDALNRAKPQAGDLGDYVDFYLGNAYLQTQRTSEAIATLGDFDKNFPDSLLKRDAHVNYANALLADKRPAEAVTLLEKDRQPTRADLGLALARAYSASNQTPKAIAIYRNLYYTMPLSFEASQADAELKKLAVAGTQLPQPSLDDRKTRASLLLKGKQYADAANEYQALLTNASDADRPSLQFSYGVALARGDRDKEAKKTLENLTNLSPEQDAERLYNLMAIARSANDEDNTLKILDQLRKAAPTSPWLEQALLTVGNLYLLKPDYDKAIDFYREMEQRFPRTNLSPYAHWKVAWLSLRQGRNADAKQGFEQQIALYPTSQQVSPALYWRARLAEEDNDPAMARAYYQKLSDRFRNYYYAVLARQRLQQLKSADVPQQYALLDRVPPLSSGTKLSTEEAPADNVRVQKAQLLANGGLLDFALNELQAAAKEDKGNWLVAETARLYQDAGRYDMALRTLKRAVPSYFAVDLPVLPRLYWEALFPRAYWTDLRKYSSDNSLDPYLVASLIRQESEFNPGAVSRKNAVGLMQLLPRVGKGVAKQEKLHNFSAQELFTPEMNLRLGTRYFRSMVDKFGSFEYALAAYNAGDDRVTTWMGYGKYRDPQEFVESIPFTETREYVQAILRNESVYRQLYGSP